MGRKTQIVTVALFVIFLFGFALGFLLLPDQGFSQQENRSLRTLPKFTWEKLSTGRYAEEINDYFADQFPLRDWLVGMKGCTEIALGKGENNGVILGEDGQLLTRLYDMLVSDGSVRSESDAYDPATVDAGVQGIVRADAALEIPFAVLLTGRTLDVAAASSRYPVAESDALLAQVREGLAAGDVNYVETVPMFRQKYEDGEYVYYKTDHHWTTLGAYYAYVEVMWAYGMEEQILPMDAFERQTVATDFYGTAWSAGGMKFVSPDTMELWLLGNEDSFTVTADGVALEGFYSTSYLATKDKFSTFLDGTHDVVTVERAGEDRPTLVIFKDSFANNLAPFLAQHFDLVLLNLSSRRDYTNVSALCEEYEADYALIVYTLENMLTADRLAKLR
ncbi:MAG: hypothetical protein IJX28_02960 [Clostridia bacterium]|nr:hypothetical protein [Clostridia bacterium]